MANKNISGDVNVEFSEAQSRQSLESGESVKTLFGKLRKWLTDLGTAAFTNSTDYAATSHTQPSSTINAMTGYSKPQSTAAIEATDTLNQAIGKLEKAVEDAGSGGETIPPIVINNVVESYTKNKTFSLKINFDPNIIINHPVRFELTGGFRNSSNSKLYMTNFHAIVLSTPFKGSIDANGKLIISNSGISAYGNYKNNWGSINPVSDTYLQFYPYLWTSENNPTYVLVDISRGTVKNVDTIIGTIIPIDFTAVTSVTYDDVTVWERT